MVETLKALVAEKWTSLDEQKKWHENDLAEIFWNLVKDGQQAVIENGEYLKLFGYTKAEKCTALELWQYLYAEVLAANILEESTREALTFILENDTLSARIVKALKGNEAPDNIKNVYEKLTVCLKEGKQFLA